MPEMPEVEGLRGFLDEQLRGRVVAEGHLLSFHALKTFDPALDSLLGLEVSAVERWGKFVGLDVQGVYLVFHLARAGWLIWHDEPPKTLPRPGKSGAVFRLLTDEGTGFTLTEAGTQKALALYVVNDPSDVPGIAALGPDPLAADFGSAQLQEIFQCAGRAQLKGVLRDQKVMAGIGNAYSDEIAHAAQLSPFAPVSSLDEQTVKRVWEQIREVLGEAIEGAHGQAPSELKDSKRSSMRVHGRTGQPCPVCQTPVAEVSFADSSLQYCPTCQTGGKPLADRRMSKLLK